MCGNGVQVRISDHCSVVRFNVKLSHRGDEPVRGRLGGDIIPGEDGVELQSCKANHRFDVVAGVVRHETAQHARSPQSAAERGRAIDDRAFRYTAGFMFAKDLQCRFSAAVGEPHDLLENGFARVAKPHCMTDRPPVNRCVPERSVKIKENRVTKHRAANGTALAASTPARRRIAHGEN